MVSNMFGSKKDAVISINEMSKAISHNYGEIICNLLGKLRLGMIKCSIWILAAKLSNFKFV